MGLEEKLNLSKLDAEYYKSLRLEMQNPPLTQKLQTPLNEIIIEPYRKAPGYC